MALGDLQFIRTKVRRIVRMPSAAQITDDDLDNYINTFILYDFPEHLRLFQLRDTFQFVCQPNRDTYKIDELVNTLNPDLNNFEDIYINIHPPVYVQGRPAVFTQSRSQFYSVYPNTQTLSRVGGGDGVTTLFVGTIPNVPVLRGTLAITSITSGDDTEALSVQDDGDGLLFGPFGGTGTINYITGDFTVTFPTAPNAGVPVNAQYVAYQANIPQTMMVFDNSIILRPVPDQPYVIQFEVDRRPTQLIESVDFPRPLTEWFQWIAYGAAKKIFEDRSDLDSVQQIMPEFQKQELLCLRRTLVQLANSRNQTIYEQQTTGSNLGAGWWGVGMQ